MKKKWTAALLGLFLILRLLPAFSIFWSEWVSMSLMHILTLVGDHLSFVLLEWILGIGCVLLLISLLQRNIIKIASNILLIILTSYLVLWYPLYFLSQPTHTADMVQVSSLCEALINELNASDLNFTIPDDLPAKFIRFPEWMDALGITGLCSFFTGEALVSPELENISLPFVAVHERMHLQGHAGEGAANIAAWRDCMIRGGTYAVSARVWALRYGMGMLRKDAPALYEINLLRMNHETLQAYRKAGGAYSPNPTPVFLQRLYSFLGIETALQNYEILAPCLAA